MQAPPPPHRPVHETEVTPPPSSTSFTQEGSGEASPTPSEQVNAISNTTILPAKPNEAFRTGITLHGACGSPLPPTQNSEGGKKAFSAVPVCKHKVYPSIERVCLGPKRPARHQNVMVPSVQRRRKKRCKNEPPRCPRRV